jgi:hypothetical protein
LTDSRGIDFVKNARWFLEPSNRDWGVGRRNSLVGPKISIHGHCLIFHARVCIPKLQGVLNALGLAHGMVAVDMLARVMSIQLNITNGTNGRFEVKLPTIWTDEKQRWSRRIEKRRQEERRSENRKSHKKQGAGARKGRKVAKHSVLPMICVEKYAR